MDMIIQQYSGCENSFFLNKTYKFFLMGHVRRRQDILSKIISVFDRLLHCLQENLCTKFKGKDRFDGKKSDILKIKEGSVVKNQIIF